MLVDLQLCGVSGRNGACRYCSTGGRANHKCTSRLSSPPPLDCRFNWRNEGPANNSPTRSFNLIEADCLVCCSLARDEPFVPCTSCVISISRGMLLRHDFLYGAHTLEWKVNPLAVMFYFSPSGILQRFSICCRANCTYHSQKENITLNVYIVKIKNLNLAFKIKRRQALKAVSEDSDTKDLFKSLTPSLLQLLCCCTFAHLPFFGLN